MGLIVAAVIGVSIGGYIGLASDRHQRRHDDHRPEYLRRVVHPARIAKMHIIEDIWQEDLKRHE